MSLNSQIALIARCTAAAASLAALGACSQMPKMDVFSVSGDKVLGLVQPYRVEIVQGNVVTKEQMQLVKTGMTRAQVRDAIGSPLLTDVFHDARWDYVFTIRRQGAAPQNRRILLTFDGDQLAKIDAPEDLPSEKEFIAAIDTTKVKSAAPKLEMTEEERKALPPPVKQAAVTPEPIGPVRDYPPLEARR
ncbi:outer membrane protein assembly factor BamE [Roseateles sp. SL47]|jgi:outer membrane protein assembly factor BamE|uniref:outer membrane protein assembly factor BamE n=1 Tax=Roseateles sp. SL47 TaxID=2995138 RepID=UPI00226DA4E2|nr:outer membrane protein assembly factor BamE [Roseateles sp. SL47]WAC74429.1 outer membrane protein assembly factor BamE [Roseateles sp. SL47]